MRYMWRRIFRTAALAFMLCLTGLVLSGEAQAQRFVDNRNGTVTDTQTGLMWTKNANPIGILSWVDAMSRCSSFSISGIGGWRLPSRNELVDMYHAIQGEHPFTGVQSSNYWSSTTFPGCADHAWSVYMYYGFEYYSVTPFTGHVWPVRAGQ